MKHKLVASIGVLLPSVQLIVDGQRNTLLETTVVRRAPKESVVADKRSDITGTNTVLDSCVDDVGENSDLGALVHLKSTVKKTVDGETGIAVNKKNNLTHTDVTLSPGLALISINHVLQSLFVKTIVILSAQFLVVAATVLTLKISEPQHLIFDSVGKGKAVVHVTSLLELSLSLEAKCIGTTLRRTRAFILVVDFGVHRRRTLEPRESTLAFGALLVGKTGTVANTVLAIVLLTGGGKFRLNALHTVVIDVDGSCATLVLVMLDGSHDRDHGRDDDTVKIQQRKGVATAKAVNLPEWNFEFFKQIPAGRRSWKTLLTTTMKKNCDINNQDHNNTDSERMNKQSGTLERFTLDVTVVVIATLLDFDGGLVDFVVLINRTTNGRVIILNGMLLGLGQQTLGHVGTNDLQSS
ncbi:hypothetical protein HG531_010647 [Fusarium graminearum]|nr:hypothetical protein HG531_010647 [Fusarium graminearum]